MTELLHILQTGLLRRYNGNPCNDGNFGMARVYVASFSLSVLLVNIFVLLYSY